MGDPVFCDDCGAPIEWYPPRERWASRIADGDRFDAWSFTCRTIRVDGTLIAADYHHAPGEPQQHFPMKAGYTTSLWHADTSN